MTPLSEQIAAASPDEQRDMLGRLWGVWWQKRGPCKMGVHATFTAMLDCGAFLSAAEMLVPDAFNEWQVGRQPWKGEKALCYVLCRAKMRDPWLIHAATPALALAAAIAKSLEHKGEE